MEKVQINLLLLAIEALGYNKNTYKDIDRIYKTNRYECYKLAKEDSLYNHPIIIGGSLIQEEYCKKLIGLFAMALLQNEEISQELDKLIQKAYRWTYLYVKNHQKIDMQHYIMSFNKKQNKFNKEEKRGDWNLSILFFLVHLNGNEFIYNQEEYNKALYIIKHRQELYREVPSGKWITEISTTKEMLTSNKEEIRNLKKTIYKKHGKISNIEDIGRLALKVQDVNQCEFLFDYENLSNEIFYDLSINDKDIDFILMHYIKCKKDVSNIKNATEYLIIYIYVLYLLRAYKQVKKMYFENNKETMYIELEEVENELTKANTQLKIEKQAYNNLDEKYKILEKENERLKAELEQEKKNRQELNGLREFFFSLNNKEEYLSEDFNKDSLKEFKAVLIGGHEKWQHKMKEYLPNFTFIHLDNINFDKRILDGISHLFVFPNYLSHPIYYKATNAVAGKGAKVIYLENQNEDLVLRQIYTVYSNAC